MGLYRLFGLCLAVFSISSLTYAQQSVDVVRNPTTSYYEVGPRTYRAPSGFSVSPSRDITPSVSSAAGGGLNQSIPSRITIDANKQSSAFSGSLKAGGNSVKNAAIKCLKSLRCNAATLAGSVGLELLLDNMNWDVGDNGVTQTSNMWQPTSPGGSYENQGSGRLYRSDNCDGSSAPCVYWNTGSWFESLGCSAYGSAGRHLVAMVPGDSQPCKYGFGPVSGAPVPTPVSDADIDSGVNDNYVPHPSDWRVLSPDLDLSAPDVVIEVPSIPSIETPPITTTKKDSSGSPISVDVEETRYDISVRPGTNDSKSPALDVDETTTTTTYDPDSSTVSSSTTTRPLLAGEPVSSSVNFDIPTDCAFMPTVCAFIDWFKDMSTEPEPDLSVILTDHDYEQTYTIDFGAATCPEPIDITISFIDQTVQLSYEPACDFVGYARPFILISAYIFAIYIGLGVVRNG